MRPARGRPSPPFSVPRLRRFRHGLRCVLRRPQGARQESEIREGRSVTVGKGGSQPSEITQRTGFAFQPNPELDLFGLGFNWGEPNETAFQPGLRDPYSVEAFYRFQLAEHLAVMPDIQFLVHPALNTEVDSIWVFGVRARLEL